MGYDLSVIFAVEGNYVFEYDQKVAWLLSSAELQLYDEIGGTRRCHRVEDMNYI